MAFDRAHGAGGSKQAATGSAGAAPVPGKRTLTEHASSEAPAGKTVGNGGGGGGGSAPTARNSTTVNGIQIFATQLSGVGGARTRVGVGEDVMFSTAGRGGRWSAARSISTNTYPGNDRTTFMWKAPATPGEVEIRYEPESGEARVVTMTVVAPDSVVFTNMQELPAARAGANMHNKVVVGLKDRPTPDVSFSSLQWKEQGGGDAAAPKAVTGYFERYRAMGGDLIHHPEPGWLAIDENLTDDAGIDGLPPVEHGGGQPRWAQGSFHWDIPNKYKVNGAGDEHLIGNVKQEFEIKPSGEVTVKKGYPRGGQSHVKLSTTRCA